MNRWGPMIIQTLLLMALLFGWALKLEVSIAKVQTDISWVKMELKECQQSSAIPTH